MVLAQWILRLLQPLVKPFIYEALLLLSLSLIALEGLRFQAFFLGSKVLQCDKKF